MGEFESFSLWEETKESASEEEENLEKSDSVTCKE
mgnify:CR=1 FL=1|jgi:hypothetical protein